jgi:hypothetical protein
MSRSLSQKNYEVVRLMTQLFFLIILSCSETSETMKDVESFYFLHEFNLAFNASRNKNMFVVLDFQSKRKAVLTFKKKNPSFLDKNRMTIHIGLKPERFF